MMVLGFSMGAFKLDFGLGLHCGIVIITSP